MPLEQYLRSIAGQKKPIDMLHTIPHITFSRTLTASRHARVEIDITVQLRARST